MNLYALLLVGCGGFIGAVSRYASLKAVNHVAGADFPYATLSVNILGSFLLGVLVVSPLMQQSLANEFRLFLIIGILGSFTTFSTFSLEAIQLMQRQEWALACTYITASVAASLAALWLGIIVCKMVSP